MELSFPGFKGWASELQNSFRLSCNKRCLNRKVMAVIERFKFNKQLVSRLEKILKTYYPVRCMYELTVVVKPA